jgi:hypothetical protein
MGEKPDRPGALRLQGAATERLRWLRGQEAQVVSESPPDAGFGLAALDTAKTFEFENPFRQSVLLLVTIQFEP